MQARKLITPCRSLVAYATYVVYIHEVSCIVGGPQGFSLHFVPISCTTTMYPYAERQVWYGATVICIIRTKRAGLCTCAQENAQLLQLQEFRSHEYTTRNENHNNF